MAVRMQSKTTPTKRTLAHLQAQGWVADIAERRVGPVTHDLFGAIDIVAAHPEQRRVLFVQCTSSSNFASRLAKTKAHPTTELLLRAGVVIEVWGWSPESPNPRVERLGLEPGVAQPAHRAPGWC